MTFNPRLNRIGLRELLAERLLVLDGAMGTRLQEAGLTAGDFGGEHLEGCNEHLVLTRPDLIARIHHDYLEAGADLVETNTFGATPLVLAEYGLADQTRLINRRAAEIARETAARFDSGSRTRWVAGSIGPTTRSLMVTGGLSFDDLVRHYSEQVYGLIEGGADLLLIETVQDTLNAKAAILACRRVMAEADMEVPLAVCCTIEPMGTTLAGQSIEALCTSLEHAPLTAIGLNCATGPTFMTDYLRALSALADRPTIVMPNAGLPDESGHYHESPDQMAGTMARFVEQGWVNLIGGCCGTTPEHIRRLADIAASARPRQLPGPPPAAVSGVDYLPLDDYAPVIVGERTNVIGSRAFKRLIADGDFEKAAEIGRRQVREGAHLLDICLADPDREEATDAASFLDVLTRKVRVPLMIDTTDPGVLEIALRRCQGKAIINSINLEDGESRFAEVAPLVRSFGAAVVVGCIDEDPEEGMARTRQRKREIALRSHRLLTETYGLPERDLIFDPLVFPVGTGDRAYVTAALETIEGVKAIKQALPRCRTILGISNVSFGLPAAGREVLNAVFLHLNLQSGLDMAIVNAERLLRVTQIEEQERRLCEDLIFNRGNDPLGAFVDHFSGRQARPQERPWKNLPLLERLPRYIVEGSRDGLQEDLTEALAQWQPLEIINGPLMAGMAEVGRLFNDNQLIVAEVLQSAEAMKAAVRVLEPHMDKISDAGRGTVLLATVKGDVHDIGKNLVDIILSNNGYRVINLGIKVPPQVLIQAAAEHQPDLIGLSGLLVKSAQQMVITAQELRQAGIEVPLLVGGAALTRTFADARIAPAYQAVTLYAREAMEGLSLADRLRDPQQHELLLQQTRQRQQSITEAVDRSVQEPAAPPPAPVEVPAGGGLDHTFPLPAPPDLKPHLLDPGNVDLDEVFTYINKAMLYGRHLGLKGRVEARLEAMDPKAVELQRTVRKLQDLAASEGWLRPRGVWRFWRAVGEGNDLVLLDATGTNEAARFSFLRQQASPRRCLSDFVRPAGQGEPDSVALFVVSAGEGVRERAAILKEQGRYLWSYALQALALETAEALAEWLHARLRRMWGIPDPPDMTMSDRFKAHYRGIRVSFGFPACPRLEDQEILFRLLEPKRYAGVSLTDGYMMDPEASVSALVFHHPAAGYFNVEAGDRSPG